MITHSIAESQHIAIRNIIFIMSQGKLHVWGNVTHLKSNFCASYAIVSVLKDEFFSDPLGVVISTSFGGEDICVISSIKATFETLTRMNGVSSQWMDSLTAISIRKRFCGLYVTCRRIRFLRNY